MNAQNLSWWPLRMAAPHFGVDCGAVVRAHLMHRHHRIPENRSPPGTSIRRWVLWACCESTWSMADHPRSGAGDSSRQRGFMADRGIDCCSYSDCSRAAPGWAWLRGGRTLTVLWAAIAAGPVNPVQREASNVAFRNSGWFEWRCNIFAGVWFHLVARGLVISWAAAHRDDHSSPLRTVGRDLQISGFARRFLVRRSGCAAGLR